MCLHRPVRLHLQSTAPARRPALVKRTNNTPSMPVVAVVSGGASSAGQSNATAAQPGVAKHVRYRGTLDGKIFKTEQPFPRHGVPQWAIRVVRKKRLEYDSNEESESENESETRSDESKLNINTSDANGVANTESDVVVEVAIEDFTYANNYAREGYVASDGADSDDENWSDDANDGDSSDDSSSDGSSVDGDSSDDDEHDEDVGDEGDDEASNEDSVNGEDSNDSFEDFEDEEKMAAWNALVEGNVEDELSLVRGLNAIEIGRPATPVHSVWNDNFEDTLMPTIEESSDEEYEAFGFEAEEINAWDEFEASLGATPKVGAWADDEFDD